MTHTRDFAVVFEQWLDADPALAAAVAHEAVESAREDQWYWERVEAAATTEEDDED